MRRVDEGFVVFAGSQVTAKYAPKLPNQIKTLREQAIEEQLLTDDGGYYRLSKDYVFSSSSKAASFVSGTSRNGLESWKNQDGMPLKYLEESMVFQANQAEL